MVTAARDFVPSLSVDLDGADQFATRFESFDGRVFGGEVLAKAVSAAAASCNDRALHSLHGYFLRRVKPDAPARLQVARLSEGRRLAARRVDVLQDGKLLAEFVLSFTGVADGAGFEHDVRPLAVPPPEELPDQAAVAAAEGMPPPRPSPLEWRFVEHPGNTHEHDRTGRWRAWVRVAQPLPAMPLLHAAAFAYLSDYGSLVCINRHFGSAFVWDDSTSLDHAVWLHRPLLWDDWVLIDSRSDIGQANRCFTERRIYAADGRRIATITQEGLFAVRQA